MKTLGFTGRVVLARVRGRIAGVIQAHEILHLPDDAAADLRRAAGHRVCDLTLSHVKAPYDAMVPAPLAPRFVSWNELDARRRDAARRQGT